MVEGHLFQDPLRLRLLPDVDHTQITLGTVGTRNREGTRAMISGRVGAEISPSKDLDIHAQTHTLRLTPGYGVLGPGSEGNNPQGIEGRRGVWGRLRTGTHKNLRWAGKRFLNLLGVTMLTASIFRFLSSYTATPFRSPGNS